MPGLTLLLVSLFASPFFCGCSDGDPLQPMPSAKAAETTPRPPDKKPTSDAERITHTERLLEQANKDLDSILHDLEDPESEFAKAERTFKSLDESLAGRKKELTKLKEAGNPNDLAKAEAEIKTLTAEWNEARDRFNLAITARKAMQEKQSALAEQIKKYEQRLGELKGEKPAAPATPSQPPEVVKPSTPSVAEPSPKSQEVAEPKSPPPAVIPGIPVVPGIAPPAPEPPKVDAEVEKAKAETNARKAELQQAETKARSVEDKVQSLRNLIETEERLLAAERETADKAQQSLNRLTEQAQNAAPSERLLLIAKMNEAQSRLASARERIATGTDRLSALNEELRTLQQERIEALQEIDRKKQETDKAEEELAGLLDPLSRRNIQKWVAGHGLNLILIVFGILVLYLLNRLFSRQIVRFIARNSHRGTEDDRENRAKTLVGVFRYAANLFILGGGSVILLDEAGIPVVPLMGGAAVVGLAVAFGAQNLIKDYFTGFMMLLEDQYGVNDVVRIGSIAGQVERITLRVTVLRDLEGVLHFIPHGSVSSVSNLTHGWSRALFDIPVPHSADLNRTMDVLVQLGKELRNDPAHGLRILEDPELLGVDSLDGTASVVRFLIKTRPLQQWAVKRELLRRIKLRFDELGIAIPAPLREMRVAFADGPPEFGAQPRKSDLVLPAA